MNGCCYNIFMKPFEAVALRSARRSLVGPLRGKVLEIGCGTGANFEYYAEPHLVTAADPDPDMLRFSTAHLSCGLTIESWRAEELPVLDQSLDHVVSTLVFCSVDDLDQSLREIKRVLRPEGTLHLIEHVRGRGLAGRLHEFFTPLWAAVCGGCHLNRSPVASAQDKGFQLKEHRVVLNFLGTPFVYARMKPQKTP